MAYTVNPSEYSSMFAVPASVADRGLKLAGAIQLKVLLLALRNGQIEPEEISKTLHISEPDVLDALNYWVDAGVLLNTEEKRAGKAVPKKSVAEKTDDSEKPAKLKIRPEIRKPSREEIVRRGAQSPEIAFMLREAQLKFSRPLKPSESSTLVWLHDDEGMEVEVILMLIAFAVSEGKATVGFIERTAVSWINEGVSTLADAEEKINLYHARKSAWHTVERAMGIDRRLPSAKETEMAYTWVHDYGYNGPILKLAYDACVDATAKVSFAYIKKIIESWHKAGVKTPEDIEKLKTAEDDKKAQKSGGNASYDMALFNDVLNKLPGEK